MNDYAFGNFLCSLREQKGYTQADIAQFLGVTPAAVSKWENGESKPRTETLFKLAEILGVRADELIAGRRLESESIDPAAIDQIYRQYAHLAQTASYNTAGVKFKRILAWIIDWNITGLFVLLLLIPAMDFFIPLIREAGGAYPLILLGIILLYPVLFILRDLIGRGRSLGKRIMGLLVVDKRTGAPARRGQRFLRNLLLFLSQIDGIILLITGRSVGDMLANTVVISKKQKEEFVYQTREATRVQQINAYPAYSAVPQKKRWSDKKIALAIIGGILAFFLVLVLIITIGLNSVKDTEQYEVAYAYLVNSEAYQQVAGEDATIHLNGYTLTTSNGHTTATFTFVVNSRSIQVVCQKTGDDWVVMKSLSDK